MDGAKVARILAEEATLLYSQASSNRMKTVCGGVFVTRHAAFKSSRAVVESSKEHMYASRDTIVPRSSSMLSSIIFRLALLFTSLASLNLRSFTYLLQIHPRTA